MKKNQIFAAKDVSLERGSHFQDNLEDDPFLLDFCSSEVIPIGTEILMDNLQLCDLHDPNDCFRSKMLERVKIEVLDEAQTERLAKYLDHQESPFTLTRVMILADFMTFDFVDAIGAKIRNDWRNRGREDIAENLAALEEVTLPLSNDEGELNGVKFTITSSNSTEATFNFVSAKRYEITLRENGEEKLITVSKGRKKIHVRVK